MRTRIIILFGCVLLLLSPLVVRLVSGISRASHAGVVLRVGTDALTAAEFEALLDAMPGAQLPSAERQRVVSQLIRTKMLAQHAKRSGLDRDWRTKLHIQLATDEVLARAMDAQFAVSASKVPDGEIERYYQEHRSDFDVVEARHILISYTGGLIPPMPPDTPRTRDGALEHSRMLCSKLRAGADFATLAARESADRLTAAVGGSLGGIRRGQLPPAMERVLFLLADGDVTDPIETAYGFDILQAQMHKRRELSEVRPEIASAVRNFHRQQRLKAVTAGTQVFVDKAYFGDFVLPDALCPTCGH